MKYPSKLLKRIFVSSSLPLAVYLFFTLASGGAFGSPQSVGVALQQAMIPSIIGWGIMFNMTVGSFDLSPGSMIYLVTLLAGAMENQVGIGGMIAACLIIGMLCGLLNGAIYTLVRIPSFIFTVSMMLIYETLAKLFANGRGFLIASNNCFLGQSPYIFLVSIFVATTSYLILNRTKFGKNVKAIGNNDVLARMIGVNINKIKFFTFFVVGCFTGVAALIQLSYGGSAWPPAGTMASASVAFQSILAFQIAFYIRKYCPLTIGMFIGAFVMSMMNSGMISINVPGNYQQTVIGIVLVIIVIVSQNSSKMKAFINNRKHLHEAV